MTSSLIHCMMAEEAQKTAAAGEGEGAETTALRACGSVSVDAVGGKVPRGAHLARYGGGSAYTLVEPLRSAWLLQAAPAAETGLWTDALPRAWPAPEADADTSSVPLGAFGSVEVPASLEGVTLDPPHVQLLVSRMPSVAPEMREVYNPELGDYEWREALPDAPDVASVMLHGWLFSEFFSAEPGQGRRAHQKFPLFCIGEHSNLRPHPVQEDDGSAEPQWLRTDGSLAYADQHVHRDEPVDIDGVLFSECFFGSDMARFALADASRPAAFWLACVDVEVCRAMVAYIIVLPATSVGAGDEVDDAAVDRDIAAAQSLEEVQAAVARRWGNASS